MKRLKGKLLGMEANTQTYTQMYEGSILMFDPAYPAMDPVMEYDPTYYHKGIGYLISRTHKAALDKPTVTIQIPCSLIGITERTDAVADFCLRSFVPYVDELNAALYNRNRPHNENGYYYVAVPGGEILPRNASYFAMCPQQGYEFNGGMGYVAHSGVIKQLQPCLCIMLQVQLPFRKNRKSVQMLCRDLPYAVERFVLELDHIKMQSVVELSKRQAAIRSWLANSDYCAFIANGSILPRTKNSDQPMPNAIPFKAAPGDEIEVVGVRGMGIKKGVTVITGGGYSGKSTLLDAISSGIYDHVLGDGRELCITDASAVTISAEDGRSIKHVNISPFIKWLPGGDTKDFSTEHASGSTSQAANIMEAVNCGAKLLLIDEDRSATNFMIRDRMMKVLIEKEPITPFTDRVNELHKTHEVSTILVIGGSGEYLTVADKIYMMEDYLIRDVTEKSKAICYSHGVSVELPSNENWMQSRVLYSEHWSSYPEGSGTEKLEVSNMGFVIIGDEKIDVRGLHNIVSPRQLDTLGFMLRYLMVTNNDRKIDLNKTVNNLYLQIDENGIDFLYSSFFTTCERFLDLPRKQELMAAINRMRRITMVKDGDVNEKN